MIYFNLKLNFKFYCIFNFFTGNLKVSIWSNQSIATMTKIWVISGPIYSAYVKVHESKEIILDLYFCYVSCVCVSECVCVCVSVSVCERERERNENAQLKLPKGNLEVIHQFESIVFNQIQNFYPTK